MRLIRSLSVASFAPAFEANSEWKFYFDFEIFAEFEIENYSNGNVVILLGGASKLTEIFISRSLTISRSAPFAERNWHSEGLLRSAFASRIATAYGRAELACWRCNRLISMETRPRTIRKAKQLRRRQHFDVWPHSVKMNALHLRWPQQRSQSASIEKH